MNKFAISVVAMMFACIVTVSAQAQSVAPAPTIERLLTDQPGAGREGGWVLRAVPYGGHAFNTDLGKGDLSVSRAGLEVSGSYWASQQLAYTLGFSTEYSSYDFSGFPAVPGNIGDPISDALTMSIRPGVNFALSRELQLSAGGIFTFSGDPDADLDDASTVGGFLGSRYVVSDDFSLIMGLGATTGIEEDISVFPAVGFNWNIDDDWQLGMFAARGGIRLRLGYDLTPDWTVSLSTGWEARDYRLDSNASIPSGVMRDDRLTVGVGVSYKPEPWVDLTLHSGVVAYNNVTFENSNGNEVFEDQSDMTPFIGASALIRF